MARRRTSTRRKTTQSNQAQVKSEPVSANVSETSPSSMTVKLEAIVVPEQQIRRYFDPDKMAQLTASIKEHGILENLLVRPLPQQADFSRHLWRGGRAERIFG
jgi:ParB family chromosome partitioning protein